MTRFSAPKDGSTEQEYEDAWAYVPDPTEDGEVDGDSLRFAIADGASESLLAGRWARLLTKEFVTADPAVAAAGPEFAATATGAAKRWTDVVSAYVDEREELGRPLKWYERPGLDRGAYATLLVMVMNDSSTEYPGATWRAAALGDSCLFQIRDDRLLSAFPLHTSGDFGVQPELLNSRGQDEDLVAARTKFAQGDSEQDDWFFLCTDALAAWFLSRHEAGERPWTSLADLGSADAPLFGDWVTEQRSSGLMRNDDVTLIRIDAWSQ